MNYSLLGNASKMKFFTKPFPFVYITDALPSKLYQSLVQDFPSDEKIIKNRIDTGNRRFQLQWHEILEHNNSPTMHDFVNYHCSNAFLKDFLSIFKDSVREFYPARAEWLIESAENSGRQFTDDGMNIVLNCMLCINSKPLMSPRSVRSAHVDLPDKLFTGLFYMRDKDDCGKGGDLQLYSFGNKAGIQSRNRHSVDLLGQGEISEEHVKLEYTIPYKENTFVIFLNTPHSIHGVSARENSHVSRKFFCVTAKLNCDLFKLSTIQTS
jgi:hypothetical protein